EALIFCCFLIKQKAEERKNRDTHIARHKSINNSPSGSYMFTWEFIRKTGKRLGTRFMQPETFILS
ncbi:MAG: hypothetical protein EA361_15045, partial [Bacteroidetes bacterium]